MAACKPVSEEPESRISIAIDFGTTFSGAAWHWSGNPGVQELIQNWPDENNDMNNFTDEKVETRITYNGSAQPESWGKQVKPDQARYQEFKLMLGNPRGLHHAALAHDLSDPLSLPLTPQFSSLKLTTDFLRILKQHTLETIGAKINEYTLRNIPIHWTLTVPAIWSEQQKSLTRFAAEQAGIQGADIRLVAEPEAAAVHSLNSLDANKLTIGDTFVLCDCGGGTVDLITYVIEQVTPIVIRELVRGDGDRCGGVYIDRAFANYVTKEFSQCDGWSTETLSTALEKFETVIKRKFEGKEGSVALKVVGLANDARKGIKKEKVMIPNTDIEKLFRPTLNVIKRLVQEQILEARAKRHPVTAVLPVGGLGQSPYLRTFIEQHVDRNIKVLQIRDGRTAVLRGALSKVLDDMDLENATLQVASRIARRCYGISYDVRFNPAVDQRAKQHWVDSEADWYISQARWFTRTGDQIRDREHYIFQYHEKWPENEERPNLRIHVLAWNGPIDERRRLPEYVFESHRLGTLEAALSRIPEGQLGREYDTRMKKTYLYCQPEVRITYGATELQYALWNKGCCLGTFSVQYE